MAGYKRRGKGDSWYLEVTLGTDFTGSRKRFNKTVHCRTEREAEKELARFIVECEDEHYNTASPATVSALCELYVNDYVKRHMKRNTQISTVSHFNNWIIPYLGKRKVSSIKKYDIQQLVNLMSDEGKSSKTIRNVFSDAKQLFEYAVKDVELISKNPCKNVRLPDLEKKESKSYNKEYVDKILLSLDDINPEDQALKCFILLSLFGGFRKGEILGFDWSDVDLEGNTITVRQARYKDNDGGKLFNDTPKSKKSARTISLPGFIFEELRRLDLQQKKDKLMFGQHYADSPALLRMEDGSPMNPNKPYKWFQTFCKTYDIPFYGIHSLRHTHASLLQSIGANYVDVSKRLGHSDTSTTLRIYTHLFDESRDEAFADMLSDYRSRVIK